MLSHSASYASRFQRQSTTIFHNKGDTLNTKICYDPKKLEYKQYCDQCYPHDPNRHVVNEEYAYGFICYNAHREKSKTKKALTSPDRFNKLDYNQVSYILFTAK